MSTDTGKPGNRNTITVENGTQKTVIAIVIANAQQLVYVDGKLVKGNTDAPPGTGARLVPLYPSPGEAEGGIVDGVASLRPDYQVTCDGTPLEGGGVSQPPIRYGTSENKLWIKLLNPEHPYFADDPVVPHLEAAHITAMADAAPLAQKALAGGDTKVWDTAQATLDPPSMRFLLHILGGSVDGRNSLQQGLDYTRTYYGRYGQQAPMGPATPMTPSNHERFSAADMEHVIDGSMGDDELQALIERVG